MSFESEFRDLILRKANRARMDRNFPPSIFRSNGRLGPKLKVTTSENTSPILKFDIDGIKGEFKASINKLIYARFRIVEGVTTSTYSMEQSLDEVSSFNGVNLIAEIDTEMIMGSRKKRNLKATINYNRHGNLQNIHVINISSLRSDENKQQTEWSISSGSGAFSSQEEKSTMRLEHTVDSFAQKANLRLVDHLGEFSTIDIIEFPTQANPKLLLEAIGGAVKRVMGRTDIWNL